MCYATLQKPRRQPIDFAQNNSSQFKIKSVKITMDEYINNNLSNNNLISGVVYMFSGKAGVYPGGTTRPDERPKEHLSALSHGRHWNLSFQHAVDKYGILSFSYVEYGPFPFNQLPEKEQGLCDEAKKVGVTLFNKNRPAETPHPVGYKLSAQTRRKQSRAKKGNRYAAKHFVFSSPEGVAHETFCLSDFCEQHHLDIACMSRLAKQKQRVHRGWTAGKP
jgi:hypothetical protein